MTLGTLALVGVLGLTHADDVGAAFSAVPAWVLVLAVALHMATLALRSEAWRLALASAGGVDLSRGVLHGANAAAFVAGALQSQAALPARVAVLRRAAGARAPRAGQICAAEVPIFALELCATALLLAAGVVAGRGAWWVAVGGLVLAAGVLLAARLAPDRFRRRPMLRGLAVLADRRRRGALVALVVGIAALTVVRLGFVLAVCGLPHGLGEVAWVFAGLGVFGLLPVGAGAPAGATLAVFASADIAAAVAAGLMLGASSIMAVFVYALAVGLATRIPVGMRMRERYGAA